MGEEHAQGKPFARHYSTEPFRWIDHDPRPEYSTVVAQYQARFAKQLDPLPNVMPIDHPMFLPEKKDNNIINVVYSPTSRTSSGWAQKSYSDVMLAFRRILNDEVYREKVNLYVLENTPFEIVMAARRRAHIVIDECSTGSYHSTTLEGLSCGATVIARIDKETQDAVSRMFGEEKCFPIIQTGAKEIYRTLIMLIENPLLLKSSMKESRKWMETHYSERWQGEKWIKWHRHCLQNTERSLTA
jgi:hypothetical protein